MLGLQFQAKTRTSSPNLVPMGRRKLPKDPIFPSVKQPPQNKTKIKTLVISASSPSHSQAAATLDDSPGKRKWRSAVKEAAAERPRLVLKFVWMEKNLGIALDQVIGGYGSIPLSPYYFWPRKDAWEELKVFIESKPWITHSQMVLLLNQTTDIINLWQQKGDSSS